MTRRQELEERAYKIACELKGLDTSQMAVRVLHELSSIEREVLEKVAQYIKAKHRDDFGHDRLYGVEAELYQYFTQQAEVGNDDTERARPRLPKSWV